MRIRLLLSLALLSVVAVVAFKLLDLGGGTTPLPIEGGGGGQEGPAAGIDSESDRRPAVVAEEASGRKAVESELEAGLVVEDPSWTAALAGLEGRLVEEEDRSPLPGLEVWVAELRMDPLLVDLASLTGDALTRSPVVIKARARTDADGHFRFGGLCVQSWHVLGFGAGTDKVGFRFQTMALGPGQSRDLGDILVAPRGKVRGVVLDPDGKPMADAVLRAIQVPTIVADFGLARLDFDGLMLGMAGSMSFVIPIPAWVREVEDDLPFPVARSGTDGSFELEGVPAGQVTLLVQPTRGLACTKATRVKAHDSTEGLRIKIKEGKVLEGQVVDEAGAPVAGVEVSAGERISSSPFAFLPAPIHSDAEGGVRLDGLGRNKQQVVYRRGPETRWIHAGEFLPGESLRLVVPSMAEGLVRVLDTAGRPASDVHILLEDGDPLVMVAGMGRRYANEGHLSPVADQPGTWRVHDLEAGAYRIVARAKGHGLASGLLELGKDRPEEPLVLTLPEARTLRFEVSNRAGRPVAGAHVHWIASRSRAKSGTRASQWRARLAENPVFLGRTGGDGSLTVHDLESGATYFVARHPAYGMAGTMDAGVPADGVVRLILPDAATIEGRLTENGGPPAQRSTMFLEPRGDSWRRYHALLQPMFARTGEDGSYRIDGITPGSYVIQALPDFAANGTPLGFFEQIIAAEGQHMVRQTLELAPGQVLRLDLETQRTEVKGAGILEGVVRRNGRPVEGLTVQAWSNGRVAGKTDAQGRFRFDGLAEAVHHVTIRRMDLASLEQDRLWNAQVDLSKEKVAFLEIDLNTTSFAIRLAGPEGEPLALTGIRLEQQRGPAGGHQAQYRGRTDSEGLVRFPDIELGSYQVQLDWESRRRQIVLTRTELEVQAGQVAPYELQAQRGLKVTGRLRFDLSALDQEERAVVDAIIVPARETRKQNKQVWRGWFQLEGSSGGLQGEDAEPSFEADCVAPGRHRMTAWVDGLQWVGDELDVRRDLEGVVIPMRPEPNDLVRRVEQKRNRDKKAQKRNG